MRGEAHGRVADKLGVGIEIRHLDVFLAGAPEIAQHLEAERLVVLRPSGVFAARRGGEHGREARKRLGVELARLLLVARFPALGGKLLGEVREQKLSLRRMGRARVVLQGFF